MIIKAGIAYAKLLSEIGAETLIDSHRDSAPLTEINQYVREKYNIEVITKELANPENIYHIIKHNNNVAGFSKLQLNSGHPGVHVHNVSKMDQIYLLKPFHGLKLGAKLLQYNIQLSKYNEQRGMWLIVWVGNLQAISFYKSFGFKIVAEDDFFLTENHINHCYIMCLEYWAGWFDLKINLVTHVMLLVSSNPKLVLTGSILGGELSMLTPHGKANHRLMKIIYSWMLTHKNEIPGLDINLSLLMQADLLINA